MNETDQTPDDTATSQARLEEREKKVARLEKEIASKLSNLEESKARHKEDVVAKKNEQEKARADLVQSQKKMEKRLHELTRRQDRVIEREAELENLELERIAGYSERVEAYQKRLDDLSQSAENTWSEALAEYASHRQKIATETTDDLSEHERLLKDLNETHTKHLETLHKTVQEDLLEHYSRLKSAVEEQMSARQKELDARDLALGKTEQKIEESKQKLADSEKSLITRDIKLENKAHQLVVREDELARQRRDIDTLVAQRWSEELKSHREQTQAREAHIEELRADAARANRELQSLHTLRSRLGDRDPSLVLEELRDLHRQCDEMRDELSNRLSPLEAEQLMSRASRLDEVEQLLSQTRHELDRSKLACHRKDQVSADLVAEKARARRFESLWSVEQRTNQALSTQLSQIQGAFDRDASRDARVETLLEPRLERPERMYEHDDEVAWLDGVEQKLRASNFDFPRRLLESFHTSLKTSEWSPLTVLAGVSGTGKSALPSLYSRFGGIPFLSVPVEPNWDSPQSLLGYFNSVDNQFDATPTLRSLVQSQLSRNEHAPKGLSDAMVMILLDEMNLAHVELYFSDMLSKLEERRGLSDVTLEVSLGAGVPPYKLKLGKNVLWTGTMNEDETTTSLSDKVIDRGNILYFPRPTTFARRTSSVVDEPSPLLPRATWESWSRPVRAFEDEEIAVFKQALEQVNEHMSHVGRALGHRVWQSIEHYMGNYPRVRAVLHRLDKASEDTDLDRVKQDLERAMIQAFEDQLVLKVMPKLRGVDTMGQARSKCLDPIKETLMGSQLGARLEEDFERALVAGDGAFVWHSAQYLTREQV